MNEKERKEVDEMTTKEMALLHNWFKLNGLSNEMFVDCVHYISKESEIQISDEIDKKENGQTIHPNNA